MTYRAPDGLLRDAQQRRLTPKSDFLLDLERRQAEAKRERAIDPAFDDALLPALLRAQG